MTNSRRMSPITQPLHIFRKDALHLWPETLVSIALLAAYAWADAQTWTPTDGFNPATLGRGILAFLIVISWLILISRLVHDEELVGDRQFWTTRPYTWYGLLAAKLVYIVAFIGVPFFVMQAWLLHHAGLYPTLLVPALLKNLLYITLVFLVPLFAIAAVTATFVRYISSVLAGFIYFFAVTAIVAYNFAESVGAPYIGYFVSGTLLLMIVAAVVIQYWRRKTLIARLCLIGVPVVFLLVALITPINLLCDRRYPQVSVGKPAFDDAPELQQPQGRLFAFQGKVLIGIPVQVAFTSLPTDGAISIQRVRAEIKGSNGFHYNSDWVSSNGEITAQQARGFIAFRLPQKVWDKIHDQPVSVHLEVGTQVLSAGQPYSITATESAFPLPGHAACTVSPDDGKLDCRFPFGNPDLVFISAPVHDGNCLTPGPRSAIAHAVIPPSRSLIGFSPVEVSRTALSLGGPGNQVSLCSDTRTTFTPSVEGAYGRMTLDVPSVVLDPYATRIPVRNAAQAGPTESRQ